MGGPAGRDRAQVGFEAARERCGPQHKDGAVGERLGGLAPGVARALRALANCWR